MSGAPPLPFWEVELAADRLTAFLTVCWPYGTPEREARAAGWRLTSMVEGKIPEARPWDLGAQHSFEVMDGSAYPSTTIAVYLSGDDPADTNEVVEAVNLLHAVVELAPGCIGIKVSQAPSLKHEVCPLCGAERPADDPNHRHPRKKRAGGAFAKGQHEEDMN